MKKKRAFSLTELLIVIALAATVMSLVGRFFADSWLASHRSLRRVENNQLVPILMKEWQRTLSDTTSASWETKGKGFSAGRTSVKQDGSHLVVAKDGKEKRFALPHDSTCRFSIERPAGLAPYAVMVFSWDSRYFRKQKMNQVRFVACGSRS